MTSCDSPPGSVHGISRQGYWSGLLFPETLPEGATAQLQTPLAPQSGYKHALSSGGSFPFFSSFHTPRPAFRSSYLWTPSQTSLFNEWKYIAKLPKHLNHVHPVQSWEQNGYKCISLCSLPYLEHKIKRSILFSGIFLCSFIVLTVPDSTLKFKRYMCNVAIFGKVKPGQIYSPRGCYLKEVS